MIRLPLLSFLALLAFGPLNAPLRGEEPFAASEGASNAALVYWQAFALLPKLSAEDLELLGKIDKGERPPSAAEPLLAQSDSSFFLARSVTSKTPCRWEVIQQGPMTLLPHLSKARLLARLLILQARTLAAEGRSSRAIDPLLTALLLARNIDEGVLIQMMVGTAVESMAVEAAQELVSTFDAPSVASFTEALGQLPPRATLTQAMTFERDIFGGWVRTLFAADAAQAAAAVKDLGLEADSQEERAFLSGNKELRAQRLAGFLKAYEDIIEASKLPLAESAAQFEDLAAKTEETSNPLIKFMMPSFSKLHERQRKVSERFAALMAALAANSTAQRD